MPCPRYRSRSPTTASRSASSPTTSSAGWPGSPASRGTYTLQLVLDQGAWEEVLTLDPDDADNLQDLLTNTGTVHYDIERRVLMFGVTPTGS